MAGFLMTKEHKDAIQQCWQALVDNMTGEEVLNPLFSNKVISQKQYENLRRIDNETKRNEELLLVITRKSDDIFDKFVNTLANTEQSHLAAMIRNAQGITASGASVASPSDDHEPVQPKNPDYQPPVQPPVPPPHTKLDQGDQGEPHSQNPIQAEAEESGEECPNVQSGQTFAGKFTEIDYKLKIDKINPKTSEYCAKLRDAKDKKVVIAIMDTGIQKKEVNVLDRIGDASKVKTSHGTQVACLIMRHFHHADLLDVRISTDSGGNFSESQMVEGLKGVLAWEQEKGRHVDIVNISMGLEKLAGDDIQEQIHKMCMNHIIICAGSNEGQRESNTILVPARLDGTIAVGSHDDFGNRSRFSPVGPQLDFLCPGEFYEIWLGEKAEKKKEGTSYSAPIASAVAAHVLIAARWMFMKTDDTRDDLMKILGRTSGMKFVLQQMCTCPDKKTNEIGWGNLTPYKLYEHADLNLKSVFISAQEKRC